MTHRPPTIVQIIPSLDEGGAERTTVEVTQALVAAGWRAIIVTSGGRLCDAVRDCGGEIVLLPVATKNPLTIVQNRQRLINLGSREAVDLFHARSRAPAWSAYWASRALGRPFVTTYHGAYNGKSAIKRWYNSVMVRGDRVIANSNFTRARILGAFSEQFADLDQRIVVIARGVDLASFDRTVVSQQCVDRVSKNWTPEDRPDLVKILMPARMTAWKGHEVAIEALGLLKKDDKTGIPVIDSAKHQIQSGNWRDLRLIFVGGAASEGNDIAGSDNGLQKMQGDENRVSDEGRYLKRLRALAVEQGVSDLVVFAGHISDMPAAYAAADIVIAPSVRPEAFGRVAVEAGAMGIPVIAADHGGARETVRHDETGILVPPGDASALAKAISRLVWMSPSERQSIGDAGRRFVTATFSTETMTRATLEVYSSLLNRNDLMQQQDQP